MIRFTICILFASFLLVGCESEDQTKSSTLVFSAAGARVLCDAILQKDSASNSNPLSISYGSSGMLARQIAKGARADIYISANKDWVDYLLSEGFLKESDVACFAKNRLALVSTKSADSVRSLSNFVSSLNNGTCKCCIGDPNYVPVGKYAKSVLETLSDSNLYIANCIYAKDVSSVLKYVELGECAYGLVYYSEAIQSKNIKLQLVIPDSLHAPIEFYVANLNAGSVQSNAVYQQFCDSLNHEALTINGFQIP